MNTATATITTQTPKTPWLKKVAKLAFKIFIGIPCAIICYGSLVWSMMVSVLCMALAIWSAYRLVKVGMFLGDLFLW